MPGRLVAAQAVLGVRQRDALEAPVAARCLGTRDGCVDNLLLLHQRRGGIEAVCIVLPHVGFLYLEGVLVVEHRCLIGGLHGLVVVGTPHAVVLHRHRVDARLQHPHILAVRLVAHDARIHHVEVGVKLDDGMFLAEGFAPVGHVALVHVLRLQVLELLSAEEVQIEVLLVGGHLQAA